MFSSSLVTPQASNFSSTFFLDCKDTEIIFMAKHKFVLWISLLLCLFCLCNAGEYSVHPFAAKASLLRFWRRELPNVSLPPFLLQKASPLNGTSIAVFSSLIDKNELGNHIASFCAAADLLCTRKTTSFADNKADTPSDGPRDFESYSGKNFKSYKVGTAFQSDTFKNYSLNDNVNSDDFKGYGANGNGASQNFANYADQINVGDETFKAYGEASNGATRDFTSYGSNGNVIHQTFKTYAEASNGDSQNFQNYNDDSNVVTNDFSAYGKKANALTTDFTTYANNSNIITNGFAGYNEGGNGAIEGFTSYGDHGNVAGNDFDKYAVDGNGVQETFTSYEDGANSPQDTFTTYGKGGNSPDIGFTNYGKALSSQLDIFKSYAKDSNAPTVTFTQYGKNTQFKDYFDKNNTQFSSYTSNATVTASAVAVTVEPGKFFREEKLSKGSVLPVPDLKDYMPPRSFLPRVLADKLTMSSKDIGSLVKVFGVPENSTMESMMKNTVSECERAPAKGETKRCVTSVEGMAAFAKEVLGSEVQVLTTASTAGSRGEIEIGEVKGLDGGKLTHSVSCHQSMYPYLAYYCHAVPQVRVYKAQMLKKKTKINDGVAICHVDTSVWSAKHAAFVALGGKPGEIEVCHWIFQDDLIWVPTN